MREIYVNSPNVFPVRMSSPSARSQSRLLRVKENPENYIGSIELESRETWVMKDGEMSLEKISFCQGLYRIIDNIFMYMVNIPNTKRMCFEFQDSSISVASDANWPLLFKAINNELFYSGTFSHKIIIQSEKKESIWEDQMTSVVDGSCDTEGSKIIIFPDFDVLKPGDTMKVLTRRVYDLSVLFNEIEFHLNGTPIEYKRWYQYSKLFIKSEQQSKLHRMKTDNLSLYVMQSNLGKFAQISFVNGLWTPDGTHIDYIKSQLVSFFADSVGIAESGIADKLFVIIDCKLNEPDFNDTSRLSVTLRTENLSNFVLSKVFLKQLRKGSVTEKLKEPLAPQARRSPTTRMRSRSFSSIVLKLPIREEVKETTEKSTSKGAPDVAYYGIVTDVPLDFDSGSDPEMPEMLAEMMKNLANRAELDKHIFEIYTSEFEGESKSAYFKIAWILKRRIRLPRSIQQRTKEDLIYRAKKYIRKLKSVYEFPHMEFNKDVEALRMFRQTVRSALREIATSKSMKRVVEANKLLCTCDRLITIDSMFPMMSYTEKQLALSWQCLTRSIFLITEEKEHETIAKFVSANGGTEAKKFMEMMDRLHNSFKAKKLTKQEFYIRSIGSICEWISQRVVEEPSEHSVPEFASMYHYKPSNVEVDGFDLVSMRVPVREIDEDADDSALSQCFDAIEHLSYDPLETIVFFEEWIEKVKGTQSCGKLYAKIERAWNDRIYDLQERNSGYKSPMALIKSITNYCSLICKRLLSIEETEFTTGWISYFQKSQEQFENYIRAYSSRILMANIVSLREVRTCLENFRDGCVGIDKRLWMQANSIHICLNKLIDFLSKFENPRNENLKSLGNAILDRMHAFRLSVESTSSTLQMSEFFQIYAQHHAILLQVFSEVDQKSNKNLELIKGIFTEFGNVCHLGDHDEARRFMELLTRFYHKLSTTHDSYVAIGESILTFANIVLKMIDKMRENIAIGIIAEEDRESAEKWISYLIERQNEFTRVSTKYTQQTEDLSEHRETDYQMFSDFKEHFDNLHQQNESLGIETISDDARNFLITVIALLQPQEELEYCDPAAFYSELSGREVASLTPLEVRARPSTFHSPAKQNRNSMKSSRSSYVLRIQKRAPILIDPNSPFKVRPSGRHISFAESSVESAPLSLVSPGDQFFDPDFLIPFVKNPDWLSWDLKYMTKKITHPRMIGLPSSKSTYKRTLNFTLPAFETIQNMSLPELEGLSNPVKEEQEPPKDETSNEKGSKKLRKSSSNRDLLGSAKVVETRVRKPSLEKGSSLTNALNHANREMRRIDKELNDELEEMDSFQHLEFIANNIRTIFDCLPAIVKAHNVSPKEEFVVDAIREYEELRKSFAEMTDDLGEDSCDRGLVAAVEMCGRQLSTIIVGFDVYSNYSSLKEFPRLLQHIQRIITFTTEVLHGLQTIIDCSDEVCIINNSKFFIFLSRSIWTMSPIINEIEDIAGKHVLGYVRDLILSNLTRINDFCKKFDARETYSSDEAKYFLTRATECLSELPACENIVTGCLKNFQIDDHASMQDLQRAISMVESTYIKEKDKQSESALIALISLRRELMLRPCGEPDEILCDLIEDNQNDLHGLVTMIQAKSLSSNFKMLTRIVPKWIDSIQKTVLNLNDLKQISGALVCHRLRYLEVERYYDELIKSFQFFDDPKTKILDVSLATTVLIRGLERTRDYAKTRPKILSEDDLAPPAFDFTEYSDGFTHVSSDFCVKDPLGRIINVVLDLLHQNPSSNHYCFEVIREITSIHTKIPSTEDLDQLASEFEESGRKCKLITEPGPYLEFTDRITLYRLLDLLARIAEMELAFVDNAQLHDLSSHVEHACSLLQLEITPSWEEDPSSVVDLCTKWTPLFNSIAAEASALSKKESKSVIIKIEELTATTESEKDPRDLLETLMKNARSGEHSELSSVFTELKNRAAAVDGTEKLLRELRAATSIDEIDSRGAALHRRLELCLSQDVDKILSILSRDLREWSNKRAQESTSVFVLENVMKLAILFMHSKEGRDLEKARKVTLAFEKLSQLCSPKLAVKDKKKAFINTLKSVQEAVSTSIPGAFSYLMNLELLLVTFQHN